MAADGSITLSAFTTSDIGLPGTVATGSSTFTALTLSAINITGWSEGDSTLSAWTVDAAAQNYGTGTADGDCVLEEMNVDAASGVDLALKPFTLSGTAIPGNVGRMANQSIPLFMLDAVALHGGSGQGAALLFPLTASGQNLSTVVVVLNELSVAATGLSGGVAAGSVWLGELSASAAGINRTLNGGTANLSPFAMSATGIAGNIGGGKITLQELILAATGKGGISGIGQITLPVFSVSGAARGEQIGTGNLIFPSYEVNGQSFSSLAGTFETLVFNTGTSALTTYSNFEFNSYATFGGVCLAANGTGIYSLEGTLDQTDAIVAKARFGNTDFSSELMKRMESMYIGYTADGELTLRVICDDEMYEYVLDQTDGVSSHTSRAKLGKGMKARYWQTEIEGSHPFSIDSISQLVAETSRKI